jgi:hypothetical protein
MQVTSHAIFPRENAHDAYVSRMAWLGTRVTLAFLFFNFSNRA